MNIYENKSAVTFFIVLLAFLIAFSSLYYTHVLVGNLANREEKLVDLYAKGLKAVVSDNSSGNISFLFQEIIEANDFIPVILTDDKGTPINNKNIDLPAKATQKEIDVILTAHLQDMKAVHAPIMVEYAPGLVNYIYYGNSHLLSRLKYYPYVQLTVIFLFIILIYMVFSYSRNSEQNRIWVGLAKETAHQLGTPLSSLMAWLEIFKADEHIKNHEAVRELEKDVLRLEMITARFSNIGSLPQLKGENLFLSVSEIVGYLQKRVSTKVTMRVTTSLPPGHLTLINKPLFEWVIENLCKNAIDAMGGIGSIDISMALENGTTTIDIRDTGKGIAKNKVKKVFQPGFTTKKRGWGLGLTLAKRIIEQYHKGKIYVKSSEVDKGTTFRIILH